MRCSMVHALIPPVQSRKAVEDLSTNTDGVQNAVLVMAPDSSRMLILPLHLIAAKVHGHAIRN